MAVLEFQFRPGVFRAVQFDGANLEEVTSLIGADSVTSHTPDGLQVRVSGGEAIAVRVGWWISVRDGDVFVSSSGTRERSWVPA
ncbi:hypothetical protein [Actinocorallia longicatena]|uniref:Uncharacterized protein n=1 Tax=Actinocorallia longicatena TaxID=111803 RepID=A0ABP6QP76_9ACTN